MNETILNTQHMTTERIICKCENIRNNEKRIHEDIDFIHAWDELIGAYGG